MLSLILGLVVVGFVLFLIELAPIDGTIKKVIHALIILLAILWVLEGFGLVSGFPNFHIHN